VNVRTVQIEDICIEPLTNGVSVPGGSLGRGSKLVNIVDIYEHHIIDTVSLGRAVIPDRQLSKAKLKTGDILFVRSSVKRAGAAMCSMFPGDAEDVAFGCFNIRLRPDPKFVDSKFLTFFLRSPYGRRRLLARCNTATITNISQDGLGSVEVPLPDLTEQRRIAGELERADGLRRTRRYALELADTFLPAAFIQLFGDRFKKGASERLGNLVEITGGGTPARDHPEYFTGKIPWLTSKDMRGDYIWDTEEHITEDAIKNSATKLVPTNSILVVVKSKVLMHRLPVAVACVPMCHGQDLKSIQCSNGLHHEFLRFVLKYHEPHLLNIARGANTEGLTLPMLEGLHVPKIDFKEQSRFAELVARHERLRSVQRESLRQAEHLFQSLLHRAFTN
jgi:type I restriction enzyme S subunit